MELKEGKKYETRNGRVVTLDTLINDTDADGAACNARFRGVLAGDGMFEWDTTGRYMSGQRGVPHVFDLTREIIG